VSDRCYGVLQTVLSSDFEAARLRTVININCLRVTVATTTFPSAKMNQMQAIRDTYRDLFPFLIRRSST